MKIPDLTPISLPVVGVTFGKRQSVIASLRNGDPLYFKPEPHNAYDPKALAIVTESGEHVGYIARTCSIRDQLLDILNDRTGFINAIAARKRGGGDWSWGIDVKFYIIPAAYLMRNAVTKDEDEEPVVAVSKGKHPTNRYELDRKHKDNELLRLALNCDSPRMKAERKVMSRKYRRAVNAGEDLSSAKKLIRSRRDWNGYVPESFGREFMEMKKGA